MTPRRSPVAAAQRRLRADAIAAASREAGPLPDPPPALGRLRPSATGYAGEGTERTGSGRQTEFLPPHPTKLEQASPSLTEQVRALFEDTVMPVRDIAAIAGVSEGTIYRYARKGGWLLRYPNRVAGGRTGRGRPRPPRSGPPQPKGAGGRFVTAGEAKTPHPTGLKALDPRGAARAVVACETASERAQAAFARALALHDAETQARILTLTTRVLCDIAAIASDEARRRSKRKRSAKPKPKTRRRSAWRPFGTPPAWADP